jgi:hypothetical protein
MILRQYIGPELIREADQLGNKRQDNAEVKDCVPGNNLQATLEQQRTLHINGARCEAASWWHYSRQGDEPLTWHKRFENWHGLPDLDEFVDVKGVPYDSYRLIVPVHAFNKDFAYLLVSWQHHPTYWIKGWLWGLELLQDGAPQQLQPGRPCYVGVRALRPPDSLPFYFTNYLRRRRPAKTPL